MKMSKLRRYSGILLEWPSNGKDLTRDMLEKLKEVNFVGDLEETSWEMYEFETDIPLLGEDDLDISFPYYYSLLIRRSGNRILILSHRKNIVEHFWTFVLNRKLLPPFKAVSINVNDLARELTRNPTIYVLSFVHARVPAFGASLRAISFYGDDLAEASLFNRNIELLTVFACGLRKAVGGNELLRLGRDGTVSFFLANGKRILEIEEALRFLRTNGYLKTEIWNES